MKSNIELCFIISKNKAFLLVVCAENWPAASLNAAGSQSAAKARAASPSNDPRREVFQGQAAQRQPPQADPASRCFQMVCGGARHRRTEKHTALRR